MKKRILSSIAMLMALLMLLTSVPFTAVAATSDDAWANNAATSFAGGNGSQATPYKIATAEQLAYLAKTVNAGTSYEGKYFEQTADIDLGGKDWTPIGLTSATAFKGNYNGGGHTISNLHVDEDTLGTNLDSAGLFGYVDSGTTTSTITIENLSVIGGKIQSNQAKFAYNSDRLIYSDKGGLWKAGVIAADAKGLKLSNVYTDVDIYPSYNDKTADNNLYGVHVGGLIGYAGGSIEINGCAAMGNISFSNTTNGFSRIYIGGLVGRGVGNDGKRDMFGSFYTGTISVTCKSADKQTRIGGLAGGWMNSATIKNCYMLGQIDIINLSDKSFGSQVGTVVGGFGFGNSNAGTPSAITNTKVYNQYQNSNVAHDKNYFYCSQPVGLCNSKQLTPTSISTITAGTNNPITLRSFQYGAQDASAFRLLATISTLDYQEAGYTITAVSGEDIGTLTKRTTQVYETIMADGKEYSAESEEIGGNAGDYIVALAINNIPQSGVVAMEVAPYITTLDGKTIYGNTAVLIFNNGKMMNCCGLQKDVECERVTLLGTDLSNFKIVYDVDSDKYTLNGTDYEVATLGSHVAAADLYRLILDRFGIGLDVEKKATAELPTHYIYLKENKNVSAYGDWSVSVSGNVICINANDICGFSAGVSHLIDKLTVDRNVAAADLSGSGSLQSREDYTSDATKFQPVYTLLYEDDIVNERTLEYHKTLINNPTGQTVVFSHRGEHVYYPEASLEAFVSAWYSGASILDVDVQQTKDGKWVCMHNSTLEATTNVEQIQPGSSLPAMTTKTIDGKEVTAYFLEDWTYEELQKLNLVDSFGQVTSFKIPTLDEVMAACGGNLFIMLQQKDENNDSIPYEALKSKHGNNKFASIMLRGTYSGLITPVTQYGVALQSIANNRDANGSVATLANSLINNNRVTNAMFSIYIDSARKSNYELLREYTNDTIYTSMAEYKNRVRFAAWVFNQGNDTPVVWTEAEGYGFDILGTDHCIAMMGYIKSSKK